MRPVSFPGASTEGVVQKRTAKDREPLTGSVADRLRFVSYPTVTVRTHANPGCVYDTEPAIIYLGSRNELQTVTLTNGSAANASQLNRKEST